MSARAERVVFGMAAGVKDGGVHSGMHGHLCVECQRRRALFRYRGVVKADDDHTMCFQCYRALKNRVRNVNAWRTVGVNVQRTGKKKEMQ